MANGKKIPQTLFGTRQFILEGLINILTTMSYLVKLYTRYYYSRLEAYQEGYDKVFDTKEEAEQYVLENERGFGNGDTSYRYEIIPSAKV